MGKMYCIPFNVSDFLSSKTVALLESSAGIGGYFLLLCHQWDTDGLPDNDEILRRFSKLDPEQWNIYRDIILEKFPVCENGKRRNERLYQDYLKCTGKSVSARNSVAVRWDNERNTNVLQTNNEGNTKLSKDKIRTEEDKKQEKDFKHLSEPTKKSRPGPAEKITFDYETGILSEIPETIMMTWTAAYPGIDIPAEILKAKAWMMANTKRRKTDIKKFLNNWLGKAQDRAKFYEPSKSNPATDEKGSTWKQLSSGQWQETTELGDVIVWDAQKKYQETINGLKVF